MKQKSKGFHGMRGRWILALILLLVTVFAAGSVMADTTLKSTSNLSPRLDALAKNLTRSANSQVSLKNLGVSESGPMSLSQNARGELLVYISVTATGEEQTSALTSKGATITHVSGNYGEITAYVSASNLEAIAALPFVTHVSEVLQPMVHQVDCGTALTSEGDAQLRADDARNTNFVDGTGVTVGVLSDSYAQETTPTSAADDISTGDLPGLGNPCSRTTPVNVLAEYAGVGGSDEGRAMLQIVHDLAPGASLAFASAFNGHYDFADNIIALRNQAGADIIVDDVSYYEEPMFQDGPVGVAIAQVVANGAQYYTSAGNSNSVDSLNHNISSYEASAYRPSACPAITNGGNPYSVGADCHDFDPSGTAMPYQELVLAAGGYVLIDFQWNEPWFGVVTDLDLYVTDNTNAILTSSAEVNPGSTGSQKPFEALSYTNTTGSPQTVRIFLARYSGSATPRCKYIFFRSSGVTSASIHELNNAVDTFGPSVSGHSGEDSALSIAAVPYNDSTSPESFTSHGYFTAYYGPVVGTTPASALLPPSTRLKPDVAATDGGVNTFFGQLVGADYRFYGTSAAAPHAAAVGALISQKYFSTYGYMPTQGIMETSLENTAVTIANGTQVDTGAGLIDAAAALAEALTHQITTSSSSSSSGGCFISVSDKK